jgi:hypothetical protein
MSELIDWMCAESGRESATRQDLPIPVPENWGTLLNDLEVAARCIVYSPDSPPPPLPRKEDTVALPDVVYLMTGLGDWTLMQLKTTLADYFQRPETEQTPEREAALYGQIVGAHAVLIAMTEGLYARGYSPFAQE